VNTEELIAILAAILESGSGGVGQLSVDTYVQRAVELYKAAADKVDNDPSL
jgi:hypothetical protein